MDDREFHDLDDQVEREAPQRREREPIPWGALLLLLWAVALIVFSVQNAENATVEFLGWQWAMPIALLVMVTSLVTLVLTAVVSAVYRRRRRKRRAVAEDR